MRLQSLIFLLLRATAAQPAAARLRALQSRAAGGLRVSAAQKRRVNTECNTLGCPAPQLSGARVHGRVGKQRPCRVTSRDKVSHRQARLRKLGQKRRVAGLQAQPGFQRATGHAQKPQLQRQRAQSVPIQGAGGARWYFLSLHPRFPWGRPAGNTHHSTTSVPSIAAACA